MTGRILQEDTSPLLTEANESLQNDNFIGATGFSTGSPAVSSTLVAQTHNILGVSVTTGQPLISTAGISQDHQLSGTGVTSGSSSLLSVVVTQQHGLIPTSFFTSFPVILPTNVTENNILSTSGITTGAPVISNANMDEEETFSSPSIVTGPPDIGTSQISQQHNISAASIITRNPDIGTTADPDWLTNLEIQELKQMFGGWPRRSYEVPDGRLVQAEREIEQQFGQKVSIDRKAKSLIKFGKSAPLATNSLQTIWTVGGNETYVSGNTIDSISSSSALDTEQVYFECHTVDESGNFTFLSQVVTLNGQNRVALPVPVARVSLAYNNSGTNLVGRVVVYENTALNNGIPTDVTKIHIDIPAGLQESFKAATTFSSSDYFVLTGGFGSVSSKTSGAADFYLEIREQNKVFRQVAAISGSAAGPWEIKLDPAVILPKNSDIRVRAETEDNNLVVFTVFQGYLAKIL
jgi:hypothetical protein